MPTDLDTEALASVDAMLADLGRAVETAQVHVDLGRPIDLSGLDVRTARLCRQALSLPPETAGDTLPRLEALRDTLDALIETYAAGPFSRQTGR